MNQKSEEKKNMKKREEELQASEKTSMVAAAEALLDRALGVREKKKPRFSFFRKR